MNWMRTSATGASAVSCGGAIVFLCGTAPSLTVTQAIVALEDPAPGTLAPSVDVPNYIRMMTS